ncbi:MAG: oligosaccharide flippase family protein [Hyphomicrobiaceae bacterium]|nr:oligosaccharide flippase family protein [Hyphomicrobiaceae bacterium]
MSDPQRTAEPAGRSYIFGGLGIAAARLARQLAQLAIFIVGARFLGPTEFGIYALVSAIAAIAVVVALAGFNSYILSVRGTPELLSEVLTIAFATGLAVALVGATAAGIVFKVTGQTTIPLLLLLFSIWILIAPIADAQAAILIRQGRLGAAAACEISGELFGIAIALWLLTAGVGAASLVFARIAAQCLQLSCYTFLTGQYPSLRVSKDVVKDVAYFSSTVLSARILGNIRDSFSTFIIGAFLGAASVGFFRASQRLLGSVHELLSEPARAITWLHLRKVTSPHGDPSGPAATADMQRALEWMVPLLLALAAPTYLGIAIMSEELLGLLLGDAWRPAAPVVTLLALASLLLAPAVFSEPMLGLTGKMRYMPRISLFNTVVAIALILPASQVDVIHVAWAQVASGFVIFATTIWLHTRVLGLDWRRIAARCIFLLPVLLGMAVLALIVRDEAIARGAAPFVTLLVTAIPAALLYLTGVAVLRARDFPVLIRSLKGG